MKRKVFLLIKYIFLILVVVFLLLVFLPRNYNVSSLKKQRSTQYWQLPTGSRIAFSMLPAKQKLKPFPIIYLHGGPGGNVAEKNINSLTPLNAAGFDIYFYDQIGSGLSGRLADITKYTVRRHVEDLNAIIEKLGTEKVILIAQSWGAILATVFAATNPQKIEKLVLTSPGPIFPVQIDLKNLPAPDSFHSRQPYFSNAQGNKRANNIRTKAMKFFATHFSWKIASDKEADAFATYLNYEVDKSTVCDTAKILPMDKGSGFYAGVMTYKNLLEMQDPRPSFKKLQTSVLVMKGECDNQPWGYTSEYLTVFQNSRLKIIPNAGHYLWVEEPTLYLETIENFLTE